MTGDSGGPVVPIQATFISNDGENLVENETVPVLSELNFTTDVRQFSGAFDFQVELALDEDFDVNSHDFVEFWFNAGGYKFQIGAGFIEDFVGDDTPQASTWQGNGREFAGQLIGVPFRKQIQTVTAYEQFLRKGIAASYIPRYAAFRNLNDVLSGPNRYAGSITAITQQTMMAGALIQQYADLVLNIAYQNRLGQLEVYGRGTDAISIQTPGTVGTLCKGFGQTNVSGMQVRENYSKVFSECTVFWTSNQAYVDGNSPTMNSQRYTNADARVANIYQPTMKVFSADDLGMLAGGISATQRLAQVARSQIRRSMQNVSMITVTTPYPYYTPPVNQSGIQPLNAPVIPFEVQQIWRIRNERRDIDQPMRLVGIHYKQDSASLEVQLQFVEPDTLI